SSLPRKKGSPPGYHRRAAFSQSIKSLRLVSGILLTGQGVQALPKAVEADGELRDRHIHSPQLAGHMGRDAVEGITDLLALPRRLGHLTGHLLIDGLCLLPGLGNKALALGGRLAPEGLRLLSGLIQESLCLGLRLGQYIGGPLLGVQLQLGHPLLFPAEGFCLRVAGLQALRSRRVSSSSKRMAPARSSASFWAVSRAAVSTSRALRRPA